MKTKEFNDAWNELSQIQQEAAEWDEGSMLVLAGPGSGKTRVLSCRIARILEETHDQNFRILGLTFTNKAADEMRSRIERFVPGEQGRLFLGTFHSFCADVLRQHGTHLNINPNFQIYSQESDLQAVLDRAIDKRAKQKSDLISDIDKKTLPVIQRLKALLISPDDCCDLFDDKGFGQRMKIVYACYEEELTEKNGLDFYSLLFRVYQLFTKFPAFAKRYRTVYRYICIDEFQDTNHAQFRLIRALTTNQHNNLFIVADDDQIIYQWNGASYKRIEEFIQDYSPKVIQLPMNYRCPAEIVKLANNLISYNFFRQPHKQPIQSSNLIRDDITVRLLGPYANIELETEGIIKDVKSFHSRNLNAVVILGRNRRLLEQIQMAASKIGMKAAILQRKNEFTSTPFIWLSSILRLANDRQNESYLEAVAGSFSQLSATEKIDLEEITALAQASNRDYLQHWLKYILKKDQEKHIKDFLSHALIYLSEGRNFQFFMNYALEWFNELVQSRSKNISNNFNEIFSGYEEERSVWEELTREITLSSANELTLEAFLHELQMRSKESSPGADTLSLMTIHGAKGKEFDHVYLIGLVEDELPSFQSKQKGDRSPEMEEERRNCFVAITRAKKTLTLSYAKNYRGWPKKPSRFLFEMGLLNN